MEWPFTVVSAFKEFIQYDVMSIKNDSDALQGLHLVQLLRTTKARVH